MPSMPVLVKTLRAWFSAPAPPGAVPDEGRIVGAGPTGCSCPVTAIATPLPVLLSAVSGSHSRVIEVVRGGQRMRVPVAWA